jgi:hypothetical protein
MNTKTIQHPERDIVVTPVKVKNLPAFLAAIEPVVRQLGASSAGATGAKDDLLLALATHAPNVIKATAVGAGVEEKWLGEQTTEVLVDLATAVLEVNMDFFVQVLLPRVTAAIGPLGRLSSLGGQTAAA